MTRWCVASTNPRHGALSVRSVRDLSDRTLAALGRDVSALAEQVEGASSLMGRILEGRAARSRLADFLAAEREKAQWLAPGAD